MLLNMGLLMNSFLCVVLSFTAVIAEDNYKAREVDVIENCGKTVDVHNTSIVLYMRGYNFPRPANDCIISINATEGWYTRLNITDIHFYDKIPDFPPNSTLLERLVITALSPQDYLKVHPNGSGIIGSWSPTQWFVEVPTSGSLKDYFHKDSFDLEVQSYSNRSSFSSIITAYKPGNCSDFGLFECTNGKCINPMLIRDDHDNCGDGSDTGLWPPTSPPAPQPTTTVDKINGVCKTITFIPALLFFTMTAMLL